MSELFGIGTAPTAAGTSNYWSSYTPTTFRLPSGKIRTAGDPNTAAYIRNNMGGVAVDSSMQPRYSAPTGAAPPPPIKAPTVPAPQAAPPVAQTNTGSQNSALVNALRQKPARFAGFGMGVGTSASTPQAQNVDLTNLGGQKSPGGLFQSV